MKLVRIFFAIIGIIAFQTGVAKVRAKEVIKMNESPIREIGIPVKSVNWVRLHPGHGESEQPCLYATMGQQADNLFVLQIDPITGNLQQFLSKVPNSNYPTATYMSREGKLYIGAAYAGHLLCFDPKANILSDLGEINPGKATFPCRIDQDAEGRLWIGSYGTADLACYDPQTNTFIRYGRMNDVDMYNYPLVNEDGTVACLIRQTQPHVVLFDPQTGNKKVVGPVTTQGEDTIDLQKGEDGNLYIISSLGDFQIVADQAVPVNEIVNPLSQPTLPDGSTFGFADASDQIYRELKITAPDGNSRVFKLDYKVSGSDVFYLHEGADGCIYGSSILPLHLFRYDRKKAQLVDLGRCSSATGEAYSMANLGRNLYISSYPAAKVSVYDPNRPYHFGDQPESNPQDLGRMDDISYRPRSTLAGPLGRVWLASLPDYGRWGGPLTYYDPQTGNRKAYYQICGDASCYTLAHLEKMQLIAVGTSIFGGSGTRPKVDQAVLFLWNYQAEKKIWEGTLDRPVSVFNALLTGFDGRLYGTVHGGSQPAEIFVFDPEAREFTDLLSIPNGRPLDLGLQNGPDGKIYGFTTSCVYRLDPNSLAIEELIVEEDGFSIAGPIVGRDIYFAKGHRLRAAQIFE